MPGARTSSRSSTNSRTKLRPYWHVENVLRGQDAFGKEIPAFNLDGMSTIQTVPGGLLSALIFATVTSYAIGTLIEVFERSDPIINANVEKGYYYRETLSMTSSNIRFAFAALGDIDR